MTTDCSMCDGTGMCWHCHGEGHDPWAPEPCGMCDGTGSCLDCEGSGKESLLPDGPEPDTDDA